MIVHQTPRLTLEGWELKDFSAFAVLARDPEVMRFIADGDPWNDGRIGWFLGQQAAYQEALGYCNWKLVLKESSDVVGFCGLAPLKSVGEIEIGWWLRPAYWHRGLAFEAAHRVVQAASQDHSIGKIVARAYASNTRSISLMTKLGMQFEKNLDDGPMGAIVLYGLDLNRDVPSQA